MSAVTLRLDVDAIQKEIAPAITVEEAQDAPGAFLIRYNVPELTNLTPRDQLRVLAKDASQIDGYKSLIAMTVAFIRQEGAEEYLRLTAPSTPT